MKDLLKEALMSQDMSEFGVEALLKRIEDQEPILDEVSAVVIWAITSEDPEEDDDDYLSRISTNFDYAINQLRRAQAVVDNYRKNAKPEN